MKLQHNCGTCMINQALYAMKAHNINSIQQISILEKIVSDIPNYLDQPTPSHFQSIQLKKLSEYINCEDLYEEEKYRQNKSAMELRSYIIDQINSSENPLYSGALFSVEGNNFDPIFTKNYDVNLKIKEVLNHRFSVDHFDIFKRKLLNSNQVVYICDNAGEIVFDQIFIEECQKWRKANSKKTLNFNIIVKSGPILNDATFNDAVFTHLDYVGEIILSGSNNLGLPLEYASDEVISLIDNSDLIISKGQANFETLEEEDKLWGKIFFFLKTKCIHTAAFFNVSEGSSILYHPE